MSRTLNAQLHIQECLQKQSLLLIKAHRSPVKLWPDLASIHYSRATITCYEANAVSTFCRNSSIHQIALNCDQSEQSPATEARAVTVKQSFLYVCDCSQLAGWLRSRFSSHWLQSAPRWHSSQRFWVTLDFCVWCVLQGHMDESNDLINDILCFNNI